MGAAEALGGACEYRFRSSLGIFSHVAVPHSINRPALAPQPFIAHRVALRLRVLSAVNLDDKLGLPACKVGDVWADR